MPSLDSQHAGSEDPRGRLCRRHRFPVWLHARVVAALEGALRERRRPGRDAVLWKGLYENGVDLVVTPYRGRPVVSPWWRVAPNPTYVEGESFARARDAVA